MIIVEPDAAWRARIEESLTKSPKRYMFDTARAAITYFRAKDGINIPLVLVVANRYLPTPELDNLDDPDMAALVRKFDRSRQVIWLIEETITDIPADLCVLSKPFAADDLETLRQALYDKLHAPIRVDPPNTPILLIEPDDSTRQSALAALSEFDLRIAEPEDALDVLKQKTFLLVIATNYKNVHLPYSTDGLEPINLEIWHWVSQRKWLIPLMLLYTQWIQFEVHTDDPAYVLTNTVKKPFSDIELKTYTQYLVREKLRAERDRKLYRWDEAW
jgi:hypothetical protein